MADAVKRVAEASGQWTGIMIREEGIARWVAETCLPGLIRIVYVAHSTASCTYPSTGRRRSLWENPQTWRSVVISTGWRSSLWILTMCSGLCDLLTRLDGLSADSP